MKNTVMKIFGHPRGSEGSSNMDILQIKEERSSSSGRGKYQPNDRKKEEERLEKEGQIDFKRWVVMTRVIEVTKIFGSRLKYLKMFLM